jgi:hypothetical protein
LRPTIIGAPGNALLGEHRGEVRRRPVERDQGERHLRRLRRLARNEIETRRADAETRGQRGLGGEPGAVFFAMGET